jgi:hypothetical protein
MNRLNDAGIIIIASIVGACMLAGFLVRKWTPTTEEGKVEQKVIEEVLDEVIKIEEPKI